MKVWSDNCHSGVPEGFDDITENVVFEFTYYFKNDSREADGHHLQMFLKLFENHKMSLKLWTKVKISRDINVFCVMSQHADRKQKLRFIYAKAENRHRNAVSYRGSEAQAREHAEEPLTRVCVCVCVSVRL